MDKRLFTDKTVITCIVCAGAKAAATQYYGTYDHSPPPGHSISANIIGPIAPPFKEGYKYLLTILNAATRKALTVPYQAKSDSPKLLQGTIKLIQNLRRNTLKGYSLTMPKNF